MKTVAKISLAQHYPSGSTRHYSDGCELPQPTALRIESASDGYYLLYLDRNGTAQTDTWHETLVGAFDQAQFEFGVAREDWDLSE